MPAETFLARLREIVGAAHVLTDHDVTAGYVVDWTGRFRGTTTAVVRPGTVDEVAAVVRACCDEAVAVVPQGGNTGLVGGSVPLAGEVVLSLRRLDSIGPVDPIAAQVTAGAGATLAAVQHAAAATGLAFGVDLAARDTATIGGMVATNAGGLQFVRHGGMRQQLVGAEAVLANGDVVRRLSGVEKDNTGYDVTGLLCGSEGTLGVVTAARLRLVEPVRERVTALVDLADVGAALEALAVLRRTVTLEAAELMFADGIDLVRRHTGAPPPFPTTPAVVLLVEWAGDDPSPLGAVDARDAIVATDAVRRRSLWGYRDAHTEAVSSLGVPHKLDVALPLGEIAAFVEEVRVLVRPHTLVVFGHIADGNLHVNVVGPPPDDDSVDDAVLRAVARRGGSISAEHGIGNAKRRWLHLNRTPAELAAFRALKRALDPRGILNPNVLIPAE